MPRNGIYIMRTKTLAIKTFVELNESEKAKAIELCRDWNVSDSFWHEGTIDDAKEIASLMGIDIDDVFFSGFWSQGDGACFTGRFSHRKGTLKAVKAYAPTDTDLHAIAETVQELHRFSFYSTSGNITHHGRYSHERSMRVDVSNEHGSADDEPWLDVFADFASWIYRNLERDYEYLTGDEAIAESLEANEMEFEIDGDELSLA